MDKLTVVQLKDKVKSLNLKGYSKLNKAGLMKIMKVKMKKKFNIKLNHLKKKKLMIL